jgi:hypothetical protein
LKEVRTFKYEKKNDQKTFDICGKDFSVKKSEKNKILVGGRKKKEILWTALTCNYVNIIKIISF